MNEETVELYFWIYNAPYHQERNFTLTEHPPYGLPGRDKEIKEWKRHGNGPYTLTKEFVTKVLCDGVNTWEECLQEDGFYTYDSY